MTGLLFAWSCWAQAPSNTAAERPGDSGTALLELEGRWVAALVKADVTALDAILVDTFVDTDEEGHRSDKRSLLAVLKSGDLRMSSIKLSDMHVQLYGTFAIVTGAAAQIGAFQRQAIAAKIVFTDSFLLQNGKWRAIASHRSINHL